MGYVKVNNSILQNPRTFKHTQIAPFEISDEDALKTCVRAIQTNIALMMDKVGANTSIADHKRVQETLEKAMASLGVAKPQVVVLSGSDLSLEEKLLVARHRGIRIDQ